MMRLDGWDGSDLLTSVQSRSRRGLWHSQMVRMDNGNVICECESYSLGKRRGNLFDGTPGCWHTNLVCERINALIDRPRPTLMDYLNALDDTVRMI